MLRYQKGPAPRELTELQASPGKVYGDLRAEDRVPIRAALGRDQGWLCAYCQRRISDDASTKIEHWMPQSKAEDASLQWTNLLGVCQGGAPNAPGRSDDTADQHCDTSRGNHPLFLHPVIGCGGDPRAHLRYSASGEVSSDDPRAADDLRVLRLNIEKLTRARTAVYKELMRDLQQRGFTVGELRRLQARHQLQPGTHAPPHAEFVLYHLEKKLRALAGR